MPPDLGIPQAGPTVRSQPAAHDRLAAAIDAARARILGRQHADGYWQYDLGADWTIAAE